MSAAVSFKNISKRYELPKAWFESKQKPQSVQALKDFSFEVKEGSCQGLLGPNGAGKSTTIQILTGRLLPSSGEARVLGVNPSTDPKAVHAFIGSVPDAPSFYEDISVEQNIELFRRLYRGEKEETRRALEKTELTEKASAKVKTLSKGLKQRLLIACALVHTPKVLFLDEPTVALDPAAAAFVRRIFEELKEKKTTIVLSTHLMSFAEKLCDQIIFINKGEKAAEGTLSELKKKYGEPQAEVIFRKDGRQNTALIPFGKDFSKKTAAIESGGGEILSVNTKEPDLEDIFIRLTRSA